MASTRPLSLAFKNLGENLVVRALIIDARILRRLPGEVQPKRPKDPYTIRRKPAELLKEGKVKHLLGTEIRDELMRRGAPIIGKRWELEERLAELIAKDGAAGASSALPSSSGEDAAPTRVAEPTLDDSIRSKYAAALAAKKNKALNKTPSEAAAAMAVAAESEWQMQPGAGDLLRYIDMRGMARVLLPSDDKDADGAAEGAAMCKQLQCPGFAHVLASSDASAVRRADAAPVLELCEVLGLPSNSVMIVTDHQASLSAARQARLFSTYVAKQIEGAPRRLPSDFAAKDMNSVREVIEQVNGFSFRDSSTEIRASKYKFGG